MKKPRLPPRREAPKDDKLTKLRPWLVAAAFIVAIYVAVNPAIGYAPVPRVILFFVMAILFTLIFVGELDARFEMKVPGFIFSCTGALAAACGLLLLLNHLAASEVQATRFTLRHTKAPELKLDARMVKVKALQGVSSVPYFVDGEDVYVIYPQGVTNAELRVNAFGDAWVRKELSYAGNRQVIYYLDKDFTQ